MNIRSTTCKRCVWWGAGGGSKESLQAWGWTLLSEGARGLSVYVLPSVSVLEGPFGISRVHVFVLWFGFPSLVNPGTTYSGVHLKRPERHDCQQSSHQPHVLPPVVSCGSPAIGNPISKGIWCQMSNPLQTLPANGVCTSRIAEEELWRRSKLPVHKIHLMLEYGKMDQTVIKGLKTELFTMLWVTCWPKKVCPEQENVSVASAAGALLQLQVWLWETGSCDNSFFQDVVNFVPLNVEWVRVCVCACVCSVAEGTTQRIVCIVLWMCWKQLSYLKIKCILSTLLINKPKMTIMHCFITFEKKPSSNYSVLAWKLCS